MISLFTLSALLFIAAAIVRSWAIGLYKIPYYETKLKINNIDISSVEGIGLIDIIRQS